VLSENESCRQDLQVKNSQGVNQISECNHPCSLAVVWNLDSGHCTLDRMLQASPTRSQHDPLIVEVHPRRGLKQGAVRQGPPPSLRDILVGRLPLHALCAKWTKATPQWLELLVVGKGADPATDVPAHMDLVGGIVRTHAYEHAYIQTCVHVCLNTCIHVDIHMYLNIQACVHKHTRTHTHMYICT